MIQETTKRSAESAQSAKKVKKRRGVKSSRKQEKSGVILGSKAKLKEKDSSEELLENLVFGNIVEERLDSDSDQESSLKQAQDRRDTSSDEESELKQQEGKKRLEVQEGVLDREKRKPAWHDDTDDAHLSFQGEVNIRQDKVKWRGEKEVSGTQLQQRLKSQYEKVVGDTPSWAKLKSERATEEDDDSDASDEDDNNPLLRHTGDYLTTSEQLPRTNIRVKRLTDLNKEHRSQGIVSTVEFHPGAQVALVAGRDKRLNLFQVEGRLNPKIQSVLFERFPLHCAHFSSHGNEVVVASRHKYFYVYDMIAGKITRVPNIQGIHEQRLSKFEVSPDGRFIAFYGSYGNMYLLSAQTKELITTLKMNGTVDAITFTEDGSRMMSFGDDGEVYVWDMNTRDCIHKFVDRGCIKGTTISSSRGNHYFATGSESGIINLYDEQCLSHTNPSPLKAIMNLTTPITATRFNSANEILAAISTHSPNIIKFVHLPSVQIFQNFPRGDENLNVPYTMDFSPRSGYFAIGNDRGTVQLYRLKHYADY
ncbi:U3 small nucleolar RNA-associated protein 18 homolog [Diadema antillarum]|uniref:U3 small nucleolar RNA-associated protein 18 homolog n=1 Tax=Diadema antillarum TaxID=105358 RepID=UPI003A84C75E